MLLMGAELQQLMMMIINWVWSPLTFLWSLCLTRLVSRTGICRWYELQVSLPICDLIMCCCLIALNVCPSCFKNLNLYDSCSTYCWMDLLEKKKCSCCLCSLSLSLFQALGFWETLSGEHFMCRWVLLCAWQGSLTAPRIHIAQPLCNSYVLALWSYSAAPASWPMPLCFLLLQGLLR